MLQQLLLVYPDRFLLATRCRCGKQDYIEMKKLRGPSSHFIDLSFAFFRNATVVAGLSTSQYKRIVIG